jgi:hypothetical protein
VGVKLGSLPSVFDASFCEDIRGGDGEWRCHPPPLHQPIRVVEQAGDYKQTLPDRARYAAPYTPTAGRRDETRGCES